MTAHESLVVDAGNTITWPKGKFSLIQVRGRTYVSVADLFAYIRAVETDSKAARQGLDGLARQIESLL